ETAPGQARRKPCRAPDDGTGRSADHLAAVVDSVFPAAGRASDRARIIRRRQAVTAFDYRDGQRAAGGVPLHEVPHKHGPPCFVYSRAAIEDAFATFDRAFAGLPHLVCYAM